MVGEKVSLEWIQERVEEGIGGDEYRQCFRGILMQMSAEAWV